MRLDEAVTEEDSRMRLPWWGTLAVIVGAYFLFTLFDHFGKPAITLPTLYSIAIIAITTAMRWKLRGRLWFWTTMAILAMLHVPLILFIPWTTKWIPALVVIPIGIADSFAMLWIISMMETFLNGKNEKTANNE